MTLKPTKHQGIALISFSLISLFFILLYAWTMSPVNVGYADSDELLAIASSGGVAHPPGFPLYVSALTLFLRLPLNLSVAAKGHLLSAIFMGFSAGFVYLTAFTLYPLFKTIKKEFVLLSNTFESYLLATVTALLFGIIQTVWLYGHIAEKYGLAALFTAIVLYLFACFLRREKFSYTIWVILWGTLGLAIAHNQSLILLAIPSVLLLWHRRPHRETIALGFSALLALSATFSFSLILLWYQNQSDAVVSWRFNPTVQGLVDHILKKAFSGERYQEGRTVSAYLSTFDLNSSLTSTIQYLKLSLNFVGIWIVPILFLAFRYAVNRVRKPLIIYTITWLLIGPLFIAYLKIPEDWGSQAIVIRQFIPGYVALSLVAFFGWYELLKRFGGALSVLVSKRLVYLMMFLIVGGLIGIRFYLTFPKVDLREYTLVSRRYQAMMETFAENAIVTCYSDTSCFALLYEKYANNTRPDVTIAPLIHPLVSEELFKAQVQGFTYKDNPFLFFDIITWNMGKRPVYAVEIDDYYYNFFNLEYPYMYYIPQGYYGELSRNLPDQLPSYNEDLSRAWLDYQVQSSDPMQLFHKSTIGRDHILNGLMYLKMDRRQLSLEEFNRASNIFYQLTDKEKAEIEGLRARLEQGQASDKFTPGKSVDNAQVYLDFIPALLEVGKLRNAYLASLAAVAAEPENVAARLMLASMYEKMGDPNFARLEYEHALMIDPENQTAKDQLQLLQP